VCLEFEKGILRLQRYICLHEGYRAYAGHAATCPALHNMAHGIIAEILAGRPNHNIAITRTSVCCAGLLPKLTLQVLPEACINYKMSLQQSRCWQVCCPDHDCAVCPPTERPSTFRTVMQRFGLSSTACLCKPFRQKMRCQDSIRNALMRECTLSSNFQALTTLFTSLTLRKRLSCSRQDRTLLPCVIKPFSPQSKSNGRHRAST